jgi:putative membrane protein
MYGITGWTVVPLALMSLVASGCQAQDREALAEEEAVELTDAEIAHVAVTANQVDADLGRFAAERAASPEVRAFAETMARDHMAVNASAAELVERLGVVPQENEVSASLAEGGEEARRRLEALSGAAFDRAYMEREVEYHQAVLDALDGTLIPGATNAELRSLLEGVRPAIAAHLERARAIGAGLEST